MSKTTSNGSNRNRKMSLRLTEDEYDKLSHYAEKWDMTKTDVILESFEHYVRWVNSDFDIPTAMVQKVNQLTDRMDKLTVSHNNLVKSNNSGFETLIGFYRGENYLSDIDEGEL